MTARIILRPTVCLLQRIGTGRIPAFISHKQNPIVSSNLNHIPSVPFLATAHCIQETMGAEQPFLYDPPSTYTYPYKAFNPKAVSQASFQQSPPKPARNGPLVEFNKHPDSYLILPYGNTNAKPMSPSTRKKVKYTRWAQLILRCLTLLGAIGLMICVICVRHVEETVGWVLRITVRRQREQLKWKRTLITTSARYLNLTQCIRYLSPLAEPYMSHSRIFCWVHALRSCRRYLPSAISRLHRACKQGAIRQGSRYGVEVRL